MARRRKHYRGLVRFPGLGSLSLSSSVKASDVLTGLGLGVAGSIGVQKAAEAAIRAGLPLPGVLASGSPLVGGLTTAGILYVAQRKKSPGRAAGHALGAAIAGLAVAASNIVSALMAGAPVAAAATAGFGAPLFMNPGRGMGFAPRTLPRGMGGPIFNNPNINLARLGRLQGFGDENEDGLFPAP